MQADRYRGYVETCARIPTVVRVYADHIPRVRQHREGVFGLGERQHRSGGSGANQPLEEGGVQVATKVVYHQRLHEVRSPTPFSTLPPPMGNSPRCCPLWLLPVGGNWESKASPPVTKSKSIRFFYH